MTFELNQNQLLLLQNPDGMLHLARWVLTDPRELTPSDRIRRAAGFNDLVRNPTEPQILFMKDYLVGCAQPPEGTPHDLAARRISDLARAMNCYFMFANR